MHQKSSHVSFQSAPIPHPDCWGLSYQKTTRKIMVFKSRTSNIVRLWLMDHFTLIWISFRFSITIDGCTRMLAFYLSLFEPGYFRCCFFFPVVQTTYTSAFDACNRGIMLESVLTSGHLFNIYGAGEIFIRNVQFSLDFGVFWPAHRIMNKKKNEKNYCHFWVFSYLLMFSSSFKYCAIHFKQSNTFFYPFAEHVRHYFFFHSLCFFLSSCLFFQSLHLSFLFQLADSRCHCYCCCCCMTCFSLRCSVRCFVLECVSALFFSGASSSMDVMVYFNTNMKRFWEASRYMRFDVCDTVNLVQDASVCVCFFFFYLLSVFSY